METHLTCGLSWVTWPSYWIQDLAFSAGDSPQESVCLDVCRASQSFWRWWDMTSPLRGSQRQESHSTALICRHWSSSTMLWCHRLIIRSFSTRTDRLLCFSKHLSYAFKSFFFVSHNKIESDSLFCNVSDEVKVMFLTIVIPISESFVIAKKFQLRMLKLLILARGELWDCTLSLFIVR